jgi:endonuclease-3
VLVGFGQVVCLPVGPRCDVCLLAKEKICPARTIGGNYKGRKEVGFSFDEADEDQKVIKVDEGGEDGLALVNDEEKAKPKVEIKIEEGR